MRIALKLLAVTAFGLALVGCAGKRMYSGDKLPSSEVAVITGMNPLNPLNGGASAKVISVDGEPVVGSGYKVELLPGTYVIAYSVDSKEMTTEFTLEAGHKYIIGKVFSGGGGQPGMIVDVTGR